MFRNENVLDIEYVPERLPHREQQLNELMAVLGPVVEKPGEMARRVLVTGDIGTGKTVTTKKFGQLIEAEALRRGMRLYYVHVNCQKLRGSFFHVLLAAMRRLKPRFPGRGFATHELLSALMSELDEQDAYMIITLDDAEALIDKCGSAPFYDLSRAHDERMGGPMRLSLICVVRDPARLEALDEATRSTLLEYAIHMPRYTKEQLFDILADRARLAFFEGVVRDDILEFVAEIAAPRGDARFAIQLLWRAGKLAEAEGRREIMAEHVRRAVAQIWGVPKDLVLSLPLHAKLLLLAVARELQLTDESHVRMGLVEDTYRVVCEEFGQEPRKHTQVWKYVQELAKLNILSTRPSGPGMRGRTTLIGLQSIPAQELAQVLEEELSKELKA